MVQVNTEAFQKYNHQNKKVGNLKFSKRKSLKQKDLTLAHTLVSVEQQLRRKLATNLIGKEEFFLVNCME